MTVGGVDDEDVDARLGEEACTFVGVAVEADGGTDPQAAFVVLRGQGVFLGLDEVLDGDEAADDVVLIDQRQLLDLVLGEEFEGLLRRDAVGGGDQRHPSHGLADGARRVFAAGDEPQVAVGHDAQQHIVLVDDGQTGDPVLAADLVELLECLLGSDRQGIVDHPRFGALDVVDLVGLILGREIAVDDAQTADAGHGDGHPRLGHGVHGRRDQRDVELDPLGQSGRRGGFRGDDIGVAWQEEDIVIREPGEGERIVCGL